MKNTTNINNFRRLSMVVIMLISILLIGCVSVDSEVDSVEAVELNESAVEMVEEAPSTEERTLTTEERAQISQLFTHVAVLREEAITYGLDQSYAEDFFTADTLYANARQVAEYEALELLEMSANLFNALLEEAGYGELYREADDAYSNAVREYSYTTQQLIELEAQLKGDGQNE